ncbi:hypothetical protein N3K66_004369 [Trichothecium roseum]|uniref:Uncharacterized protein n=1 Tax=Trichothecium roseum TaxID=47278 RepID=A0ACC0V1E3_9HYPO|nr:hypothetical protein N3K66_004369 [Trichothecium roseum]
MAFLALSVAAKRVQELEDTLRRLTLSGHDERERLISQLATGPSPQNSTASSEPLGEGSTTNDGSRDDSLQRPELDQAEVSIDEHGELQYFGATSRFHLQQPRQDSQTASESPESSREHIDEGYHKKWLLSNARFRASLERQANASLAANPDIDPSAAMELLEIYWAWQGPLHNCVYRPCFYRDMALDGPYCSPFLLNVLFAHACRHTKPTDPRYAQYNMGEYFLIKAKQNLVDEFSLTKPRIPTIQGLLILGGRQCAVGKHSEGWLFTGMAIRMLKDLGLHLQSGNNPSLAKLEPDDLEATKRLCLSAYAWDKSISLCLGRRPALSEMPFHPSSLLDPVGDDDPWRPRYLGGLEETYPPIKSQITLCFSWFCRLSMLVHEMYNTVYSEKPNGVKVQDILDLEERLRQFYRNLPSSLRRDDIASAAYCPPPHIFCLNLLYHTLLILLFRPFYPLQTDPLPRNQVLADRAREVCVEEAVLVNDFFRAYGQTFNFEKQSYLISYCVYTAATIEVQQVHDRDPAASARATDRLCTILKMLETEAKQTPGIRRSVDIIKSRLKGKGASPGQIRSDNDKGKEVPSPKMKIATGLIQGSAGTSDDSFSHLPLSSQQHSPSLHTYPESHVRNPHVQIYDQQWVPQPDITSVYGDPVNTEMMDAPWVGDWRAYSLSGGFVPDTRDLRFAETFWGGPSSSN